MLNSQLKNTLERKNNLNDQLEEIFAKHIASKEKIHYHINSF